ncbi:glycosyltransferase family A protein [Roseivivax isoporae]|uniref:Uncharacterized protein n=1 Tax=Roseivivax isoporae LMG 25204 TaxID=1449351 RepID=X7F7G8_9RHOB|nr:glycosyltransferase family A protein [Roseivivax isoporae]ETX28877.1 hypothetical protein RISW2_03980 [Roseivivax isoporae LMG 25204]
MICAIITPVGPGHAESFARICAPSVTRARDWSMGPFSEIRHLMMDDTEGRHGRSRRRNDALAQALADGVDWVFFLDADDVMTPNAFAAFGGVLDAEPDLDAVWGLICEQDPQGEPQLRAGQPERIDDRAGFLSVAPYLAVQIGAFVRTGVAAAIGFDTDMDTGEDYRFYRALWNGHRCAKRPEIFFLNRRGSHSTGPRAATGRDWSDSVTAQWREEVQRASVRVTVRHGGSDLVLRLTDPADPDQVPLLRGEMPMGAFLERIEPRLPLGLSMLVAGAVRGPVALWALRHLGASQVQLADADAAALDALRAEADANDVSARLSPRLLSLGAVAPAGDPDVRPEAPVMPDRVDLLHVAQGIATPEHLAGRLAPVIARHRPAILAEVPQEGILSFARGWCRKAGYELVDSAEVRDGMIYFALPSETHDAPDESR